MKYVLTATQMKNVDSNTITQFGVSQPVLMERAALGVCDEISARFPQKSRVCVVCGNGNNGGDGYAIGRILTQLGYPTDIFCADPSGRCSEGNKLQADILQKMEIPLRTDIPEDEYDIIIDAVFGVGFIQRDGRSAYDIWLDRMNELHGFKIAVDIASGVETDHGGAVSNAFYADLTITFGYRKRGLYLHEGRLHNKTVICKDIGIPDKALGRLLPETFLYEPSDLPNLLPRRCMNGHKGTFHKAGIIAGSQSIGGCAILSSAAAIRTGVGYVKTLTDKNNIQALLTAVPELLTMTFQDEKPSFLYDCSCIGIGPGLGTQKDAYDIVENVLRQQSCRLVIDADAINLIASSKELKKQLTEYAKKHEVVLTPHKKELERLYGAKLPEDPAKLHEVEQNIAAGYGIYLVCKDFATRVYVPDGRMLYINTSGNDGMATAGSGDVLTGILTGFAAQDISMKNAVTLSVYVHGLCGDYAKDMYNAYSLKASDLVDSLKFILREEDDYERL